MQPRHHHHFKTQNTIRSFQYRDQLFSQSSKRSDQQSPLPNVSACTQQGRPAHNRAERTTDVTRQWVCCSASVSGTDIDNTVLPTNIVCQTVTNYIAPYQQNTSHLFFGILKHLNYNILHTAVVHFFIGVLLTFYSEQ